MSAFHAEPFDAREWLRDQMRKTPSWAISITFHVLILAMFTLITFSEQLKEMVAPVISISVPRKERAVLDLPPPRPRGLAEVPESGPPDAPLQDLPAVLFPDAEDGPPETADDDPARMWKGDNDFDRSITAGPPGGFLGRSLTGAPGVTSSLGVGGGSGPGGRFGPRGPGGMHNRWPRGRGKAWEDAVMAGLRWLARHQGADGGWHAGAFAQSCAPGTPCEGAGYAQFDTGLTGLALLAFLGANVTQTDRTSYRDPHTHEVVTFGRIVKRAVDYLQSVQDEEGCFGPRSGEYMYNHSIATLAMIEAFGLSNAAKLRPPAERGLEFLSRAQNPYRAWRYTAKSGDNDTSVTGWCVMALKSAEISELPVARTSYDGARAWIDAVTDDEGVVGYNGKGKVDVFQAGKNEAWRSHPAMTAVGLLCKIFIDRNERDPMLAKHADRVLADPPVWKEGGESERPIDYYYWYYATLALYQFDGPDGRCFSRWAEPLTKALCEHQSVRKDGCTDGSWDPTVDRWGYAGGRVYATAMNTLTLETCKRYARAFGSKRK